MLSERWLLAQPVKKRIGWDVSSVHQGPLLADELVGRFVRSQELHRCMPDNFERRDGNQLRTGPVARSVPLLTWLGSLRSPSVLERPFCNQLGIVPRKRRKRGIERRMRSGLPHLDSSCWTMCPMFGDITSSRRQAADMLTVDIRVWQGSKSSAPLLSPTSRRLRDVNCPSRQLCWTQDSYQKFDVRQEQIHRPFCTGRCLAWIES